MKESTVTAEVLPETSTGTAGEQGSRIARIVSVRQALALADYEDLTPSDLDAVAAPAFADAVDDWGKREAYSRRINIQKSHLTEMCKGQRPIALRHIIPLHEKASAMQRFCAWWCERAVPQLEPPQVKRRLVRADLGELALGIFATGGPLLKTLIAEAQEKRGASAEEVLAALAGK